MGNAWLRVTKARPRGRVPSTALHHHGSETAPHDVHATCPGQGTRELPPAGETGRLEPLLASRDVVCTGALQVAVSFTLGARAWLALDWNPAQWPVHVLEQHHEHAAVMIGCEFAGRVQTDPRRHVCGCVAAGCPINFRTFSPGFTPPNQRLQRPTQQARHATMSDVWVSSAWEISDFTDLCVGRLVNYPDIHWFPRHHAHAHAV